LRTAVHFPKYRPSGVVTLRTLFAFLTPLSDRRPAEIRGGTRQLEPYASGELDQASGENLKVGRWLVSQYHHEALVRLWGMERVGVGSAAAASISWSDMVSIRFY
jgi:hypothetical protein